MRPLFLFLAAAFGISACGDLAEKTAKVPESNATFILVRHAEKAGSERESPLTAEGLARAERLAEMIADMPLQAVYSTDFARTIATARPSASRRGLEVELDETKNLDSLGTALLRNHKSGTVLLSGHSNTTPALVNRLIGEERFRKIEESDYTQLFVVTCSGRCGCNAMRLRY
jgi:2,3-bisphosphoglycerate-dependent phosphoglycerate mutase